MTFVFTDIEASTRTWEQEPEAMARWLATHDRLVTDAIGTNRGRVFKHTGDGVCAVFEAVPDAARAARDLQQALTAAGAAEVGLLRARVAIYTGAAQARDGDFYGPTLNRCARLLAVGHGGQVLLAATTTALLAAQAAAGDLAVRDLGMHRLRDLQHPERIGQLVAPGLDQEFPPLRSLDAFSHNLPVQRSSFVGRAAEGRALAALSEGHRLVTVTGVGGCGKTRLSLEVAAVALDRFADGVWFVELASVTESSLVAAAVASVLRVPAGSQSSEDRLCDFLADRRALLVVDNCEHVLDGCAMVADQLLARCPTVSLLATSREPLAVEGEQVWRVPSLQVSVGDSLEAIADAEATRLFVDRAAAVRPGFALTHHNAAAVGEICRQLDGIPLAIELAAARVAHMAPREILDRLADRFRLLTGGRRGVQRQQTLQAVLDWSHGLLSGPERTVLRRLAVFSGGWTLAAAQVVCAGDGVGGDVVDLLGNLVSRSLVDVTDHTDHTRYRLLETVRLYAQERLVAASEAERVRDRQAQWCVDFVESSFEDVRAASWFVMDLSMYGPEIDNLRQGADWWVAQGRLEPALRIATATVAAFHQYGRYDEPARWLDLAFAPGVELTTAMRVRCHCAAAQNAEMLGDFGTATAQAHAAIALAEDPADSGPAYSLMVANLTWVDPDEAERLLVTAAEWASPLGAMRDVYMRNTAGSIAAARHDYTRAVELLLPGRGRSVGTPAVTLVVALLLNGDVDEAATALDESERKSPEGWFVYFMPLLRAVIAARRGDQAGAREHLRHTHRLVLRWKIALGAADCVLGCAMVAYERGDALRASELLATIRAVTGGFLRSPMSMCLYRHYRRAVRGALDRDAAAAAQARGARVTLEEALARELVNG